MSIASQNIQPISSLAPSRLSRFSKLAEDSACTCTHRTVNGVTFRWSNNPRCPKHGETTWDWSQQVAPSVDDAVRVDGGDVAGRFGRVP